MSFSRFSAICVAAVWVCFFVAIPRASAQGLIWSLPEDGRWVRYEGEYREVEFRPDAPEGDEILTWDRHLTLNSVGTESAEFEGQQQPCRWIEITVVTGKTIEGAIVPGPVGACIYKVLVPESRITGNLSYGDEIPAAFIPIVKGYRKLGENNVEPIPEGVLQVYPVISLLQHYKPKDVQQASEQPVDAGVTFRQNGTVTPVEAMHYKASNAMESPTSRSTNEAEFWRSDDVPFGLARWRVRILREEKDGLAPRSEFEPASEISVDMKASEAGAGAQSELVAPVG